MNVCTLVKQYFIAKNNSLLLKKDAEHSGSGNLFFWWRVTSRCRWLLTALSGWRLLKVGETVAISLK